jgi:hypothetical protein
VPARYRSFFWPAVLILAGVIALLVNTGAIPADRLYLLFDLWPVILIVIGLEIIVRRTTHGGTADLAAALIVVVAIAGAAGYVAFSPNPSTTHAHDWSDSVGSLKKAEVEIDAGAASVTITATGDLGTDLYRAHIEYSGPQPRVELDRSSGTLRISQESGTFLQSRKFALTLELNPAVPWSVSMNSGATTDTLNLRSVHLSSLSLNSGAGTHDITLGPPSGKVPITIDGGSLTVHLHRAQSAVSIAISGGSINLTADGGASRHAIGNLDYETPGFSEARDVYAVEVSGGSCTVTLDSAIPSD